MSFLLTHTVLGSEISGGMYFHPLPSDPYLVALLQVFDLTVLSHLLSNFKNLACSEILSGEKKQKNMVAIKAFDCVAASEVNCSLETEGVFDVPNMVLIG